MTTADKILVGVHETRSSSFRWPPGNGIEFMATACSRRSGSYRDRCSWNPRQCDVMVIAGTITVKMAPRVKKLWDMMPEPKWAIAMGSCAISGDFYRNIYSVVPGVDTFMPVDVYVPGCPPNPDHLFEGFKRLQDKIKAKRSGEWVEPETRPVTGMQMPSIPRNGTDRDPAYDAAQLMATQNMGLGGDLLRPGVELPQPVASSDDDTGGEA